MEEQSPEQQPVNAPTGEVHYEALVPIAVGGVRAYNPGDKVPASNVAAHGYVVGEDVRVVPVVPVPVEGENVAPAPGPEPTPQPEGEPPAKAKRR